MLSRRKFMAVTGLGIGAVAATGAVGLANPLTPKPKPSGQDGVIGAVAIWLPPPQPNPNAQDVFLSEAICRLNTYPYPRNYEPDFGPFCHAWTTKRDTINGFAREALEKYPDAVEIRVWLSEGCQVCYEKLDTHYWKTEWWVKSWDKEKKDWVDDSELCQYNLLEVPFFA